MFVIKAFKLRPNSRRTKYESAPRLKHLTLYMCQITQGANCPIRSFLPVTWLLSAYTDRRRHTRAIRRIAEQQTALPIIQQAPPMPGTPLVRSEGGSGALLGDQWRLSAYVADLPVTPAGYRAYARGFLVERFPLNLSLCGLLSAARPTSPAK